MSKNKFTPGPWSVDLSGVCSQGGTPKIISPHHLGSIAEAHSNLKYSMLCSEEYAQRLGNAHLISAAPDLLEALEECSECASIIRRLIENIEKHGNYSEESTINFLNQALSCHGLSKSAIAKARGE